MIDYQLDSEIAFDFAFLLSRLILCHLLYPENKSSFHNQPSQAPPPPSFIWMLWSLISCCLYPPYHEHMSPTLLIIAGGGCSLTVRFSFSTFKLSHHKEHLLCFHLRFDSYYLSSLPFFSGVHLGTVSGEIGIKVLFFPMHFHSEAISWAWMKGKLGLDCLSYELLLLADLFWNPSPTPPPQILMRLR